MADLSTLDATAPAGTDAVSGGDDAIRATRDAIKTSFGGTDSGTGTQASEHYLKGFHKFPMGNQAAKPAAGNANRIYVDTTLGRIERDTGSAWAMLNAAQVYQTTGSLVISISSSWKVLASQAISVATGGRVVVYGAANLTPSVSCVLSVRLTFGSTTLLAPSFDDYNASVYVSTVTHTLTCMGYAAPAAGSYTVTIEAKSTGAGTYGYGGLIVLVA